MQRYKISYVLLLLSILFYSGIVAAQSSRDYQKDFKDLVQNLNSAEEYNQEARDFFHKLNDDEFVVALANISKEHNADFIAYNLFHLIDHRFSEKNIRNKILAQLADNSNAPDFRIVTIDFISKYIRDNADELKRLNNVLYAISKNNELPDKLRAYAAAHCGISLDYGSNKKMLMELLKSDNLPVVNGAARSAKKFIHTDTPKDEMDDWVEVLISVVQNNSAHLDKMKAVLSVLGYTGSDKARKYLLSLFLEDASLDFNISETLVYSMIYLADEDVLKAVFEAYFTYDHFNNYGSELTLMQVVNKKDELLEKLLMENNLESKITFLRSVRFVKNKNDFNEKVLNYLNDPSERVRLECIKTIHFLLPHNEEKIFFAEHLKNERSNDVKKEIYNYIGRRR